MNEKMSNVALCQCGCGEPAPICTFNNVHRGYVKGQPMRFIHGHNQRLPFDLKAEDHGHGTKCLIFQGKARCGSNSKYGKLQFRGKTYIAHRFFFERERGPIPEGMEIDHLCRVPLCCNVEHLEVVPPQENTRRRPYALSYPKAVKVRELYSTGKHTYATLAKRFGVSQGTIRNAVKHICWNQEYWHPS